MKKIAVLVHSLVVEYAATVVSGIYDYFKDKEDVSLLMTQTRQPHFDEGLYEYQYWTGAELLKSECVDALIVVSNSYLSFINKQTLVDIIKQFKTKYIISIGMDLGIKNSYSTVCKPDAVYEEIIEHLKNKHGCKKIGFFSANLIESVEGKERYTAFQKALKKNNLEFNKDYVLDGKFTISSAKQAISERFTKKEDIPFDSIVCANDLMACGVIQMFTQMGVRIPQDIKVVGFDNTSHATVCNPPITTVDQQIAMQGYTGAEMAYKLLNGEKLPSVVESPLKVIYRNSCGCKMKDDDFQNIILNTQINYFADITKIDVLLDLVRGVVKVNEFVKSFKHFYDDTGFDSFVCCIYEHPVLYQRNQEFDIPDRVKVLFYVDVRNGIEEFYENGEELNPYKILFPDNLITNETYMFQPLYLGNLQYGYLLCRITTKNFPAINVNLKILTSLIAQSYDYSQTMKIQQYLEEKNSKLLERNSDLKMESKTDELTKILNRRGFFEYARRLISFSADMGTNGLVFFGDLDGLKTINDNYGHDYGDLAIQTIAMVFKKAFRQSDVIGRLSGDEFSIVAPGMNIENLEPMKNKIKLFCEQMSKENNLPFTVSVSLGAVTFTNERTDLNTLLKEADDGLYEEKKLKHSRKL